MSSFDEFLRKTGKLCTAFTLLSVAEERRGCLRCLTGAIPEFGRLELLHLSEMTHLGAGRDPIKGRVLLLVTSSIGRRK